MTDKQIIIDGVDVSGCSEIRLKQDGLHTCWEYKELDGISNCKDKPNCLYKQLKAKERECEELTSKSSQLEENFKQTADGLLKIQYALADHCNKYSKTLAEIKEIAESEMDSKEFMAVQYMLNGSVDNKNKVLKQILQKINEVEDDNTRNI